MKKFLLPLLMACFFVSASVQAGHAAPWSFGKSSKVVPLQVTSIQTRSGEAVYLGHVFTRHSFLGGLYLEDGGYVITDKEGRWYTKLTKEQVISYQNQRLLPIPLPEYRISLLDYAIGYSLWLFIAVVIGWSVVGGWYRSLTAERRIKKLQAAFPKFVSCAIVANGVATQDRIALADNWHSRLFGEPLDQEKLHKALKKAEESGPHLMNLFGAISRTILAEHRETVLIVFSDILLSAGYGGREREVLEEAGKRLKFRKKDIQELIKTFDARQQASAATA